MTLSYLHLPGTAVVNAAGTANITFRPDVGQWWLPTIVHVSNRTGNLVRCNLHSGGIAALTDPTTVKDLTFQGNNDTSSILSGTVIAYGEGITCEFTNGTPGDTVFAEVVGQSADAPPPVGILPEIPGARFIGASTLGLQTSLLTSTQTVNLTPGFFHGNFVDMSPYGSFQCTVEVHTNGAATVFNPIAIWFDWYETNSGQLKVLYSDGYWIYPRDSSFTFGPNGRLSLQDNVHGPFLRVTILNNGADTCTATFDVYGSSRAIGRRYVVNTDSTGAPGGVGVDDQDSALYASFENLGNGATITRPMRMAPGPCGIWYVFFGTNTVMQILDESTNVIFDSFPAVGVRLYQYFALPKSACLIKFINQGGGTSQTFASVITGRDNW